MFEMSDKTEKIVERKFMDYFGMTVEQFDELDFDTQQELIQKVAKLRNKMKRKEKGVRAKFRFGEIFTYYPIENKENRKEKIKSIFKK